MRIRFCCYLPYSFLADARGPHLHEAKVNAEPVCVFVCARVCARVLTCCTPTWNEGVPNAIQTEPEMVNLGLYSIYNYLQK